MDDDNKNVFVSGVKRNSLILENNLYEIIQRDVAKPILSKIRDDVEDNNTFNFIPSGGKFYIPKKKSKLKVLTIRDVRVMYEEDILQTLPNELEKQQKLLLRKIKHGFAKDENTKSIAINLLKSNNPISRLSWQMLTNLNPEDKIHSSQYILWDGKCIRVNGSKGGRNKFICNYDVYRGMNKDICKRTTSTRSKLLNKKRCLLRASLDVRFKPGPLSKKKRLDYSYQKHNVGEVKLVNLPKPILHIQPMYGTPIEPTVKTFLQTLREDDGTISAKWAEFAVSMLGKVTNQAVHTENENFVTFNLNYKYNQNQILMRQDRDSFQDKLKDNLISQDLSSCTIYDESTLTSEVRTVVDKIVDAVEISLNKDLTYPAFDEPRDILTTNKSEIPSQGKEKVKRRYGELDRLDVTVIRLSESHKKNVTESCQQTFCNLGCICDSLECNYNLKDHCGNVDCMFNCKCDFSNYKFTDSLDGDCSHLYPGLYYLDQKINGKLAKEEQKFHQTVILKDDKSILLKSNRRNWKATKKYADFYNSMPLRSKIKNKKILSVVVTKLNCRNIEPWCMVHNLYKCFCKGKFTESLTHDPSKNEQKLLINEVAKDKEVLPVPDVTEKESTDLNTTEISYANTVRDNAYLTPNPCSRVLPYKGRNHGIKYYKTTNKKIMEMEKNDIRLQAKMINILNQSYVSENTEDVSENTTEVSENTTEVSENTTEVSENTTEVSENTTEVSENTTEVSENTTEVIENTTEDNENKTEVSENPTEVSENTTKVIENTTEDNENIKEVAENTEEVRQKPVEVTENLVEGNEKSSEINTKAEKVNEITEEDGVNDRVDVANVPFKLDELLFTILQEQQKLMDSMNTENKEVDLSDDVTIRRTKRLPNKTKLVQWLETSYKKYKEKLDKGFWKTSLSPPKSGKVALYPWNFILSRYRERKNLFLISKQKPFRIFMAVDTRNPFFSKCINVNLIPRSHLDNYPVMIRNLLKDVKDQNETFCILCGLSLCWELVGSVTKVNENKNDELAPNVLEKLVNHSQVLVEATKNETNLDNTTTTLANKEIAQISKWFVMTIEDDFIEIQFFKKGFFIKYDSIVRAIVVSRQFGKTVRLSSQKCNEGSNDPQFGLYAIPNMQDNCVFIGPYEKDEPLGIEALRKSVIVPSKNKTRGMWITVNKVDNAEVINNPLSFMPSFNNDRDQVITFGNDGNSDSNHDITPSTSKDDEQFASENSEKSLIKTPKLVKPVKINKADCFKLPFKILTKPLPGCIKKGSKIILQSKSPSGTSLEDAMISLQKETEKKSNITNNSDFNEALANIEPQIKISNIASLCDIKSPVGKLTNSKRPEKGMFVLKPEEINERLAFNYFRLLQPDKVNESSIVLPTEEPRTVREDSLDTVANSSMDENSLESATIWSVVEDSFGCPASSSSVVDSFDTTPICLADENSLESPANYSVGKNSFDSSSKCSPPATDVYVISDDEDSNNLSHTSSWEEIWISCTNIKNLGWIPGRRSKENKLSFKFPGFACTDFYEEEVAFKKINQVFTRKVYVLKTIKMEWRVVNNVADINVEDELTSDYLNADYVLTKYGLVHKNSLVLRGKKRVQKDNKLLSSKKLRVEDETESDNDKIEAEYINLPEDKDNSDVDVSGDDTKSDDNDKDFSDDLFEDKDKMDEYRKVFGCAPTMASIAKRMKQFSTILSKKEVSKLDSAD
ncbi:PREDICTED: uncharacterized protein LOC106123463 [Papilio xuthus]|uniref:Uncharacterized protein LOC106123463 n=1 Tax=Papilio xuthus TaxID=66420 RepID=A0AAJ6ZM50_PAPXU|nr:PREDICTED: uncharacterized protein LOC106123463 [Papilio xuthus]XP_013175259.1 PREDICTED: uncharacterized protein LOC106123463 [Papilio xuthus]XP_013175260.1 PREDICTED: uncharacterized protein LOC106123463 [Papilio xuthus]